MADRNAQLFPLNLCNDVKTMGLLATHPPMVADFPPSPLPQRPTSTRGRLMGAEADLQVLQNIQSGNYLLLPELRHHSKAAQEEPKPNFSYIGLIAKAILSSDERRMVLSEIYEWIQGNYSYFRSRGPGWRNSIRHNLSLNDCFVKIGRSSNGKGHYWGIHPANVEDFRRGDFRRRRAQRKVRRALGLSCPGDSDDSDSPLLSHSPTTTLCPTPIPFLPPHHSLPIDSHHHHHHQLVPPVPADFFAALFNGLGGALFLSPSGIRDSAPSFEASSCCSAISSSSAGKNRFSVASLLEMDENTM